MPRSSSLAFGLTLTLLSGALPARAQSNPSSPAVMDSLEVILQHLRVLHEEQNDLRARMAGLAAGLSQVRTELQRLSGLVEAAPAPIPGNTVEAEIFDGGANADRRPAVNPIGMTVDTAAGSALGSPDAPVTLIEFSDFQCPFCRRHNTTVLPVLKARYVDTGLVRYVFRHYPLAFHPLAPAASEAALCAGEQGRFWEMHDLLFEGSSALNPDRFPAHAASLKLDEPAFADCVQSGRFRSEVQDDVAAAETLGFTGTPYFLLGRSAENGTMTIERVISGARALEDFESAIDALLEPR